LTSFATKQLAILNSWMPVMTYSGSISMTSTTFGALEALGCRMVIIFFKTYKSIVSIDRTAIFKMAKVHI
jgi:hypothetical protein